jgi:hypothetical protein
MKATDVVRIALTSTQNLVESYLGDLSDADLLVRPVPGANHIAWQLGHLIAAEVGMGKQILGIPYPELPAGFVERHAKSTATVDSPKGFATKAEYLNLFNKVRKATLDGLAKMSDADLDKPSSGNMAKFAPTFGAMLQLLANHTLMHGGQFTVVRRKLGKPVIF